MCPICYAVWFREFHSKRPVLHVQAVRMAQHPTPINSTNKRKASTPPSNASHGPHPYGRGTNPRRRESLVGISVQSETPLHEYPTSVTPQELHIPKGIEPTFASRKDMVAMTGYLPDATATTTLGRMTSPGTHDRADDGSCWSARKSRIPQGQGAGPNTVAEAGFVQQEEG
jgi:hypothetical protein